MTEQPHHDLDFRPMKNRAERILESSSLRDLARHALEEFAHALGARGGSIYALRDQKLERLHALETLHAPKNIPLPLTPGSPFEQVMRTARPLLVENLTANGSLTPSGWEGYQDGSFLIFPLLGRQGKPIALLALHNKTAFPFNAQDQTQGVALATFAAKCLQTAKQTEVMRGNEDRFHAIFDKSPDAIFIKDRDRKYTQVNPGMERVVGMKAREFIGRADREIDGDTASVRLDEEIDKRILDGETIEKEVVKEIDGVSLVFQVIKFPILDASGEILALCGIARDITEQKRMGEQLRLAQKMESLGQLAGGVAHDFNNLLQTIIVHAQFALENLAPDNPGQGDLKQVLRASEKAALLTRQLLTFSQQQRLNPVDINLNRVVADLMKMLRRLIGEDIELLIIPEENLGNIHADPGQIEQIVMNLSINARDAMPEGGRTTIETSNRQIDATFVKENKWAREGQYVLLTIRDTGVGMTPKIRDRIFEPFFTTKEAGKGTGLGLATVYGIVQQLNGLLHVESSPDQGATFHVYLPTTPPSPESTQRARERAMVGGTETILLAEDDEIVRNLIVRLLGRSGYTTFVAADGQEAVALFEKHADEIQIAVLDVVMPRLSGRVVYEAIRASDSRIPILFCSGYSTDHIQAEFIAKENLTLLNKPYNPRDLLNKIREMLDES